VWDRNTQRFTQQNQGALCKTPLGTPTGAGKTPAPCGIPQDVWESNGASEKDLPALDAQENQILVRDHFYQYGPLHGDGRCSDTSTGAPGSMWSAASGCAKTNEQPGYFGNKVLAVSYGAVLALKGYKGATYSETDALASVNNWRRLADGRSLQPGETELVLESAPDWGAGDEIVVTTTD
jgi:cell migration-inducing and hyaluronan-binding protein